MDVVWKFIGTVLVGFGGAAAVITVVVKFASEKIADALQKKYQLKLDKEFEAYKVKLAGKEYVSKAYFDKEIEIYQNVAKSTFDMVRDISVMVPYGYARIPADETERKMADKEHYEKAIKSAVLAQDILNQNAPFIAEEIYQTCSEIRHLCGLQLGEYEDRFVVTDLRPKEEKDRFSLEAYKRTREINEAYECFTKQVRDYLKNLEII